MAALQLAVGVQQPPHQPHMLAHQPGQQGQHKHHVEEGNAALHLQVVPDLIQQNMSLQRNLQAGLCAIGQGFA